MIFENSFFKITEKNIGRVNLFVTLLFLFVFVIALTSSTIISKYNTYERLKTELYTKFIKAKKEEIRSQVLNTNTLFMNSVERLNLSEEKQQEYILNNYRELNRLNPKEYFVVFKILKNEKGDYVEKVLVHPYVENGKFINMNRKDLSGKKFVQESQNKLLKYGSTYLNYSFIHPKSKKESEKIGFFILNKWNWVISRGFFVDDSLAILSKVERNLYNDTQKEIKEYIFITILFLALLVFFILKVNKFTLKTINKFKNKAEKEKQKLKDSEDYLKQYTNIIERCTIVTKTDINGNFTYVSDAFCKLLGYKREEILGKSFKYISHPETSENFNNMILSYVTNKKTFSSEIKNLTKDGKTLYFIVTISPVIGKDGGIIEFISYRFDITKEILLQQKLKNQNYDLKKSEKILNAAQKIAHIGNWEYNHETKIITFSEEAARIYGFDESVNELPFEELKKMFHKEDLSKVSDVEHLQLNKYKQFFIEHRIVKPDNSLTYVEVKGEYSYSEDGKVLKSMGIINDVTERKVAEKKLLEKDIILQQQSKMAAMGEMISNIAHQWRQPLSLISTVATGAKLQKEMGVFDDSTFNETLTVINDTSQYLSKTIDDFRNFFKPGNEKRYFKISDIVLKTVSLIKPQFKNREIEIIEDIKECELYGLENEFIQVVINILNNARDQLLKLNSDKYIFIKNYKDENKHYLTIKDNGGGIKENIISRIFEPYFTTKHSSEGTGIGLYMSEEIITKHMNGKIYVNNVSFSYNGENYKGAEFTITLPLEFK